LKFCDAQGMIKKIERERKIEKERERERDKARKNGRERIIRGR